MRLAESQLAIGLAVGGEPGSRLAKKLAMPVSGDTILRLVRAARLEPPVPPRIIGIDDWAWRRGTRYGSIIRDLERNQVIDLFPDRNVDSVAAWLKLHPGIEIIARDRAGVYSVGARRGAPDALQIADRWHLLNNLGDALRHVVGRNRRAVAQAGRAVGETKSPVVQAKGLCKVAKLRADRRGFRRETFAEIVRLRAEGVTPSRIGPLVGMSTRAVQRWLAAGGEPEHRRPPPRSTLIGPFRGYILQRWQEGCHSGKQLLEEIRDQGYRGSYNILAIYLAEWRHGAIGPPAWRPPSHRRWAWLLSQDPEDLDADSLLLLNQLSEHAPDVVRAGVLAREFVAMLKGNDQSLLEPWIAEAETSELKSLANGIRQDISASRDHRTLDE